MHFLKIFIFVLFFSFITNQVFACMGGGEPSYQSLKNLKIKPVEVEKYFFKEYGVQNFRHFKNSKIAIGTLTKKGLTTVNIKFPNKYIGKAIHLIFDRKIDIELEKGKPYLRRSVIKIFRLKIRKEDGGLLSVGVYPNYKVTSPYWIRFYKNHFVFQSSWFQTGPLTLSAVIFGKTNNHDKKTNIITAKTKSVVLRNVCSNSAGLYR